MSKRAKNMVSRERIRRAAEDLANARWQYRNVLKTTSYGLAPFDVVSSRLAKSMRAFDRLLEKYASNPRSPAQ